MKDFWKKGLGLICLLALLIPMLRPSAKVAATTSATQTAKESVQIHSAEGSIPKYIFFFIGDGMSHVQANAARVYKGDNSKGDVQIGDLSFTRFDVNGLATTHDSTSFCPDSASTASAFSCGIKTHSGVIGLERDKETAPKNIAQILKEERGMDIGVASTVTINHATPAAFYAHVASRGEYYEIAMQMAKSGYNFFGGGQINQPTGREKDQEDAYEILEAQGYTLLSGREAVEALTPEDDLVYAYTDVTQNGGAMPYSLDSTDEQLQLADYVQAGIQVMSSNPEGFFFAIEAGKIDWACHANDAKASIYDTLALDEAVQVAVDFAKEHPDETLIVVTGDHETGGLTIGQASTGYDTAFDLLAYQKLSYTAFDQRISEMKEAAEEELTFKDVMPLITESFGLVTPEQADTAADERLVLNAYEMKRLIDAFALSMLPREEQISQVRHDTEQFLRYGYYNPLSVTLTHLLNNKSGIGWTSYAHTGTPVAVYATGAGSEYFAGSYDNVDVFGHFLEAAGISK